MIRPIVLVSMVLPVLAGPGSAPSPATDPARPVRRVTKAPRVADIEFVGFEFQQPTPMHMSVDLVRIEGEPSSGTRYPVEAKIGGEKAIVSATFEVIAEDGTLIQPLLIAPRGTAVPGYFEFIGLMDVPSRPFRIVLTGQSVDGRLFRRVDAQLFRPVNRPLERRPAADLPPEHAAFRRWVDEEGTQLVADTEAYVAEHATIPMVMPRTEVSKVMSAPLMSAAGSPIGVRITYEVEFSQAGRYNPMVQVHPEYLDESDLGGSAAMRVMNTSVKPLPRRAEASQAPAATDSSDSDSVLGYGADSLYAAQTVYHFTVELVPGFIETMGRRANPCIRHQRFQTAQDPQKVFATMPASENHTAYRVYIGGGVFEGRIENFYGEGTFYRSFVAEAVQACPQLAR